MPKYYLLDENKNLVEGFDKEGFLAILEQAIEDGSLENIDPNSAVASKIKSLLNGTTHNLEFVTQAQYNELETRGELVPNTYYFITDDTTLEGLEESLNDLTNSLESLETDVENIKNGTQIVGKATNATNAEKTEFTNGNWIEVEADGSENSKIPNFSPSNLYLCFLKYPYGSSWHHTVNLGIMTMFDDSRDELRSEFPNVTITNSWGGGTQEVHVKVYRDGRVEATLGNGEGSTHIYNVKFRCKLIK